MAFINRDERGIASHEWLGHAELDKHYLLYIGPTNTTAINEMNPPIRRAHDQHSVIVPREDKPDIDVWEEGTLKVYCPSFLPAFKEGEEMQRLNEILHRAEGLLYNDVPLIEAIKAACGLGDSAFFESRMRTYIETNIGTPDLAQRALADNFAAYDRSIALQDIFREENVRDGVDNFGIVDQAVIAFARQRAIFCAMAPHYAVEAIFDDQFAGFPYHLPDVVNRRLNENGPNNDISRFNRGSFERGIHHILVGAPSPDTLRFSPVLASLIVPSVMKGNGEFEHYDGWDDFKDRVIERIEDPLVIRAMEMFAKGMEGIPLHFAYFAAYKMAQKEVRKRGIGHLYDYNDARLMVQRLEDLYKTDLAYAQAKDFYFKQGYYEETEGGLRNTRGDIIDKFRFQIYFESARDRAAIEHVNSVIGSYKFVPWRESDENFRGVYLPYSVMKEEKARIVRALMSPEFSSYWRSQGYWFRDCLPELMASHPSMYSKWFMPLLERGMVDDGIIKASLAKAEEYLAQLLDEEKVKK